MNFRTLVFALSLAAALATPALAIPIGGPYGTVAICIIDTLTDAPLPIVQFAFAGAPVARVTTDGLETQTLSCSFRRIVHQSGTKAEPVWTVSAQCGDGNGSARNLTLARTANGTLTVSGANGKPIVTVDACALPYADRAARELKRISASGGVP